ncbi:MAG: DUF2341 domain-containing protein [Chitinivibrionales bacterium]|nr:DUF2341 domain-containing protein [Chitinivibrionales bacterium]
MKSFHPLVERKAECVKKSVLFSIDRLRTSVGLVAIISLSLFGADYPDSGWSAQAKIYLNTSSSGANVANPVYNFPVLIRLDSSNFNFSAAKSQGEDIRFTKSDSTKPLYYEIEEWDQTGKRAVLWVKVDTIRGGNSSQYIRMYWGNPNASSESNGASVFDSSNGFAGVWHLNESGALTKNDATGNGNNGKPENYNGNESIRGVINGADSLGNGEYISIEQSSSLALSGQLTISAWVKRSAVPGVIFAKGLDYKLYHTSNPTSDALVTLFINTSSGEKYLNLTSPIDTTGGWSYVTATVGPSERTIYYNGASANDIDGSVTIPTTSTNAFIGAWNYNGMNEFLEGPVDEVRVSSVARSDDWIMLCYKNQHPGNQSLVIMEQDMAAPQVTTHPQSQNVDAGTSVTFTVTATGFPAPQYQWFKGTSSLSGATGSTYRITNVQTSDAGDYKVAVWNSQGSDTSNTATLQVTSAVPSITSNPQDYTVLEGGNAEFSLAVTGSSPMNYKWYQEGGGLAGEQTALTLSNVQQSMSGNRYYCIVSNSAGSDTSGTAGLTVVRPVHASFETQYQPSKNGLTVVFTDKSTGSINSWVWRFGDGSVQRSYSSKRDTIQYLYTSKGTYTCTLIVDGGSIAGNDRYTYEIEYAESDNPVTITARSTGASKAEIAFSNLSDIPTQNNPISQDPWATQIGVWYNASETPFVPSPNPQWTFSIDDMLGNLNNGIYYATVNIPRDSLSADSAYFWTSPLWDKGISPFSSLNAAKTRMLPNNRLTLSAEYLGNEGTIDNVQLNNNALDSAVIYIKNLTVIDTPGVAEIVVWYGLSQDDTIQTRRFSVDEVLGGRQGSRYEWRFANPVFQGDTQTVYVHQVLVGNNGNTDETVAQTSFIAGWPKPPTATALYVDTVKSTSIGVRWDAVNADSIRILYVAEPGEIELGKISDQDILSVEVVSPPSSSDTRLRIGGLDGETKYTIALQYLQSHQWTEITSDTRRTATTDAVDPSETVQNSAVIDSAGYDPLSNGMAVAWRVQMISGTELDLAVTFSTDSLEAVATNPDNTANKVVSTIGEDSGEKQGVFTIAVGGKLEFEKKYYFALWLRNTNGPWAGPGNNGVDNALTPSFTWELVRYFAQDTIKTFNGKAVMFKDDSYTMSNIFTDTAYSYTPENVSDNFIPVSIGFSLGADAFQPFNVGIYYDSIPKGYSASDLGLFRDSVGVIIADYNFTVDSAHQMVYTKTKKFVTSDKRRMSFIVMADSKKPEISFENDIDDAIDPDEELVDEVTIDDNIANVRWRMSYARNDDPFSGSTTDTGFCDGTAEEKIRLVIPSKAITPETGVRALLIIEDGVHRDSINISRRALRENSDVATTEDMQWIPVAATATLDDPSPEAALRDFAEKDKEWRYNPGKFRLFRWVEHEGNENSGNKWVEYSDDNDALFEFTPGKVVWLKAREAMPFGLGKGKSVSLKEAYGIELAPQQWTDFALPFLFNITIGDILEATGDDAESLEFYSWVQNEIREDFNNTSRNVYISEALYIEDITGLNDAAEELKPPPLTGYTVYNRSSDTVTLRIPPVPSTVSSYKDGVAKLGRKQGWNIKIEGVTQNGMPVSPIYCGYTPEEGPATWYSLPRSFSGVSLGVYDSVRSRVRGHTMKHQADRGVFSYMLALKNDSEHDEAVTCSFNPGKTLPNGYRIKIMDPSSQSWIPGSEEPVVEVPSQSTEFRILAVGAEDALNDFARMSVTPKLGLAGCYPNPVNRVARIYYTLPWTGIRKVVFEIFDVKGRKIWSYTQSRIKPGTGMIEWEPSETAAGGVFMLTMKAWKSTGKECVQFKDKLMILR